MRLGAFEIDVVSDGTFALDGGAMFGVVPRVLWERQAPADQLHRVRLGLNCLLVRTGSDTLLIDTGIGEKWDERSRSRYAIAHETTVFDELAKLGVGPNEITIVLNTHLHFDHAGTNTVRRDGDVRPAFPNARYVVQRGEFEHATGPHERDRASYNAADFQPLAATRQIDLIDGDARISTGISALKLPGHNRDHQCVKIESGGETVFVLADLIPTTAHLPPAWVMGYDLFPTETVDQKKRLLPQAVSEGWICHFYHDPTTPLARLYERDGKVAAQSITDE